MFTTSTLVTCTCSECGIEFAMPEHFSDARHRDHQTFYCPNGHSQYFPGKTREQRRIDDLERRLAQQQQQHDAEIRSRKCAERKVRKLTKEKEHAQARAAAGTCPCCRRNFKRLRRHMKEKHPEFIEEVAKKRCPSKGKTRR